MTANVTKKATGVVHAPKQESSSLAAAVTGIHFTFVEAPLQPLKAERVCATKELVFKV